MANLGYLNVKDFGAKGDGVADDTAAIQAAFTAAAAPDMEGTTVFIPAGIYMVSNFLNTSAALQFTASGCKLTGGGTLKHIADPDVKSGIILRIFGNRNFIDWIRIDGNVSGGALSTTDGYTVVGMHNHSQGVFVTNIGGSSIVHFGKGNRMDSCSVEGSYECLKDGGDYNIARYCSGVNYTEKGYNNTDDPIWTTTIGCYFASPQSATAGSAYQIDPQNPPRLGRAIFRDCSGAGNETTPAATNVAKFAVVDDVYLTGCLFTHATAQITTLRFANNVGRARVDNCFLSRTLVVEETVSIRPDQIRIYRTLIGDGVHRPQSSLNDIECSLMRLLDSTFVGSTQSGIRWELPESEYILIAALNCSFDGHATGTVTDIRAATAEGGEINSSRRVLWLANRRTNTGGGNATFIDVGTPTQREILGSTMDASMKLLDWSTDPSTTAAIWTRGDTVANSAPSSGGYFGWVCTDTGPPDVWKQFALIS